MEAAVALKGPSCHPHFTHASEDSLVGTVYELELKEYRDKLFSGGISVHGNTQSPHAMDLGKESAIS